MSQHKTKIADLLREIVAYCHETGHEWSNLAEAEAALIENHRQAGPDNSDALGYATRLATAMWERDWQADAPNWEPCDNLMGVLTQIDNMVAGMERKAQAQQVAGEVVAWRDHVEQRIREWRCSTTNDDGDRVALEDFMSPHHVDDLIDYVCSAYTTPPAPVVPAGFYGPEPLPIEQIRKLAVGSAFESEAYARRITAARDAQWRALLTATPTPPAQAAQAISYSDVVEREMMEMSDAAIATHQQGGSK